VISTWQAAVSDLLLAAIAILIWLVFASQRDVMEAWRLVKPYGTSFSDGPESTLNSLPRHRRNRAMGPSGDAARVTRKDLFENQDRHARQSSRTLKVSRSRDFDSRSSMESQESGIPMSDVKVGGKSTPLPDVNTTTEILVTKEVVVMPDEPRSPTHTVSVTFPRSGGSPVNP